MSVDLTLYLLKPAVTQIDKVIPEDKCGIAGYEEVSMREGFAVEEEMACWVKNNEPKPAAWSKWLQDGFDFGGSLPRTQSTGCVVLLRVKGRVFAACFGTGHHAIPAELIDHDFGLTVALNEVNPKQLRMLVTKSIDVRTRQRDTHQTAGGDVPEFALDLDVEWLRAAQGRTERVDCRVIEGAESLHLRGWNRPLEELPETCEGLLAIYAKGYPEAFSFAENIKPIPDTEPLHQMLEDDLGAAAQLRFFEHISLGIDARLAHTAARCAVHFGHQYWDIVGPDDDSLREGLDHVATVDPDFEVSRVSLRLYDADDNQIFSQSLDRLLQMEIDRAGHWYIRVEQRWFQVRSDHMKKIEARVAALEEPAIVLPTWDQATHPREENYNAATAVANSWLLQDQVMYKRGAEEIEPCDLLTPSREFIHVKDGTKGSSELSHLFGQASASADLLAHDQAYFTEMKRRFEAQWPSSTFEDAGKPKVVVAIARKVGTETFGKMMLSRLNVLEHARRVVSRGFDFAVCRVDLT